MSRQIPSYRHHKPSGRAVVTLTDVNTGRRRDVYLGVHGSEASRRRYLDVLARWEAEGRTIDGHAPDLPALQKSGSISALIFAYDLHLESRHADRPAYYRSLKLPLRLLRSLHGGEPAHEFGPLKLQQVRKAMIDGEKDQHGKWKRKPWARSTVNRSVDRIIAMFAWGVSQEFVPETTHRALACVSRLRRGEQGVRDDRAVERVRHAQIRSIRRYLSRQVRGLVLFQLLTGCRVTEALRIRPIDLDTSAPVWRYTPRDHKNAHRGHERVILIGPRAQRVLQQFMLGRPIDKPVFSPRDAVSERHAACETHRNQPPPPPQTERRVRDAFDVNSYRRSIAEACIKAKITPWSPRQLRKTALTRLRRQTDVETAAIVAGHSSAELTDRVYTARDLAKAEAVMSRVG